MHSLDIPTESLHLSQKIPVSCEKILKPSDHKKVNMSKSLLHADNNDMENESHVRKKNYIMSKKKLGNSFGLIKDFISLRSMEDYRKSKYLKAKGISIAFGFLSKFKNRIFYGDFHNLSDNHIQMIGDKAVQFKENPSHLFRLLDSRKTFGSKVLIFFLKLLSAGAMKGKVSRYLKQNVPVYDSNSPFKILWDLVLMALTLARLFTYSIEKGFLIDLDIEALGFTLIILQLFNILIILNTNFYYEGEQITDRRKIFHNFVKNHMITEVVPSVGLSFTYFSRSYAGMHDMNIVLLLRLLNSGELGIRLKALIIKNDKMESLYSLVILVMKILIWGHLIACIWHFVGVKSLDGNSESTNWLKTKGVADKDWRTRYLFSFYWAVTTMLTVGYGDVTPTNENEMMFNVAAMFLGCGMFGYSMNSIGEILKFSGIEERLLKDHLKSVNNIMKDKHLPSETQIKIRKYMEFVWKQDQNNSPEQEMLVMSKLTSDLRDEIYMNTNVKLLKSVPALSSLSNKTLLALSCYMKKVRFSPEEHIYREGDYEDLPLYFVIDGTLQLIKEREGLKNKIIPPWQVYRKDDYFGVQEFFTGKSRSLSVVSLDFSTLFQLSRIDILQVLQKDHEELEKFSRIKDLEILYETYDQYKIPCRFCNRDDHQLQACRFFFHKPSRIIVVGKYLERKKKKRKNFNRRMRRNYNALKKKAECSSSMYDFQTMYEEDEELQDLIKFYDSLIAKSNENDRSLEDVDSPFLKKRLAEKTENKEEETKNEDEEESKLQVPISMTHLETSKSHRSQRNLTFLVTKPQRNSSQPSSPTKVSVSQNDTKSERKKLDKFEALNKQKEPQSERKKDQESQWIMDKIRQYRYYFPTNNCKNVLFLVNRKLKGLNNENNGLYKSNIE